MNALFFVDNGLDCLTIDASLRANGGIWRTGAMDSFLFGPIARIIVVVLLSLQNFGSAIAGSGHRILILDNLQQGRNINARLLVVDVDSGKTLARADDVGVEPAIGVSPNGDLIAVQANDLVG